MGSWSHIILEGYCLYSHHSKKKHVVFELKDFENLKLGKKKLMVNEHYISPKERPNWCVKQNKQRIPQFRCLCFGKDKRCPFFAMTNAEKSDYKQLFEKYGSN